jgi:hypothetical protein
MQALLAQSLAAAHFFPLAHFAQLPPPPQSVSTSVPFLTPSLHDWHPPPEHT